MKRSKFIPRIIGMATLQRETKSVVRELDRNGDECILSVREKPAAVLMSLSRYETLRTIEDMKRQEEEDIVLDRMTSLRDTKNSKFVAHKNVWK